jgi:kinesin family protein 5
MPLQSSEHSDEVPGLRLSLEMEIQRREQLEQELQALKLSTSRKSMNGNLHGNLQKQSDELLTMRQRLDDELKEKERLEAEIQSLREQVGFLNEDGDEVNVSFKVRRPYDSLVFVDVVFVCA